MEMKEKKMTDLEYYSMMVNSSSIIKYLNPAEGGSPKKYLAEMQNMDKRKKDSIFTELGKLAHLYKLEPEKFEVDPLDKPTESLLYWIDEVIKRSGFNKTDIDPQELISNDIVLKVKEDLSLYRNITKEDTALNTFWTTSTKKYIEFVVRASGKLLLSPTVKEKISNINRALDTHPGVDFYLNPTLEYQVWNEQPLFFQVSNTSSLTGEKIMIDCKSKIDVIRFNRSKLKFCIIDIKSSGFSAYTLSNFLGYHVYRQLAFYRQAILKNLPIFGVKQEDANKVEFEYKIIAVETQEPYNCVIHNIDPMWILKDGNAELSDFFRRVAFHHVYGYEQSIEEFMGNGEITYKYVSNSK